VGLKVYLVIEIVDFEDSEIFEVCANREIAERSLESLRLSQSCPNKFRKHRDGSYSFEDLTLIIKEYEVVNE
jgi:hypothetical protein